MKAAGLAIVAVLTLTVPGGAVAAPELPPDDAYPELTARLEGVRDALGIPGMAAALVKDQELVWAQGFGYADLDNQLEVTPHTPFGLASVTKPVAAALVMQLVEEGAIDLDTTIADYGVSAPGASEVTVRHLLTHTSEGTPGEMHVYNGDRYALLGGVIEGATGKSFAQQLGEKILLPVDMMDTALNPIDSWGEGAGSGFEDFRRARGWGSAFEHYPDVYRRLTSPYQLDEIYEVAPGMYHLTHSPAAGLVSSVVDLAAFDVALDGGKLLSDASLEEMWSPAVPTVAGRSDVAYGLGWYVQEWAGHRMLWHTGRWPPSTSALYLKLPDEGLTFIVLANTDNMTVAFPGIGSGDLSRSTLMLTLFEQLVFDVPIIDWTADEGSLVQQLSAVDDPDTRTFLELELWSYRQALGSSGNLDQAAVLADVARAAFPGSRVRLDSDYTNIAGPTAVIPPVISAASVVTFSLVVLGWLVVAAISLLVMVFLLWRPPRAPAGDWLAALPAAVVLGPVGPAVLSRTNADSSSLRRAGTAAVISMTAYAAAWVVSIAALLAGGEEPNPLLTIGAVLLLPIAVGLLFVRVPAVRKESGYASGRALKAAVLPELMTAVLGVGALFAGTLFFDTHVLSTIPHPRSPFFWAMLSLGAVIGAVLLSLHYLLLTKRGMGPVPGLFALGEQVPEEPRFARWRDSWWMLVVNIAVVVLLVAVLG